MGVYTNYNAKKRGLYSPYQLKNSYEKSSSTLFNIALYNALPLSLCCKGYIMYRESREQRCV